MFGNPSENLIKYFQVMKIMIAAITNKIRISLNDPLGMFLNSYLETTLINASILEKGAAKNDQ